MWALPNGFGGNKNWVKGGQGKKECPTTKVLVALKTIGQFKIFSKE